MRKLIETLDLGMPRIGRIGGLIELPFKWKECRFLRRSDVTRPLAALLRKIFGDLEEAPG